MPIDVNTFCSREIYDLGGVAGAPFGATFLLPLASNALERLFALFDGLPLFFPFRCARIFTGIVQLAGGITLLSGFAQCDFRKYSHASL